MEIFSVRQLSFCYPLSDVPVVNDVSFSVNEGDFSVLCGHSGCGKTTLLRLLKPCLSPHGTKKGEVFFRGKPLCETDERTLAAKIGFVSQSPDRQIVTDTVWHELAFGLESLGLDAAVIRRRVAETASFFGIQDWFHAATAELSGGQKQLLNLASVMVMQPSVLILDEPTGQLDPIAASGFLAALSKINRELGTTVILAEQRLEEVMPMATVVLLMENGELCCQGTAGEIGAFLKAKGSGMLAAMPAAFHIWASVESNVSAAVSVKDGRAFLKQYTAQHPLLAKVQSSQKMLFGQTCIAAQGVFFRYEKDSPDIVSDFSVTVRTGELFCLIGGNGAGKSTVLKLLAGIRKPYRGTVHTDGKIGYLPQNTETLFTEKTVREELSGGQADEITALCGLSHLKDRHPYDLSGGEQQCLALAKLLLCLPDILLLDEPTKGMDAVIKVRFADVLAKLRKKGVCIMMVSHDIEFCAQVADCCALFFDGAITASGTPEQFFADNRYYTTSAARIAHDIVPDAFTADRVIAAIGGVVFRNTPSNDISVAYSSVKEESLQEKSDKLPLWRKTAAGISALGALSVLLYTAKTGKMSEWIDGGTLTMSGIRQFAVYGVLLLFLVLFGIFTARRDSSSRDILAKESHLSRRTIFAVAVVLLLIPATLLVGLFLLERRQYYLTALAILFECMLPFFMVFEGRHPKPRELVLIASLCAVGVAGRAAFLMLPQFKPVLALTVITGVALGSETGFLVGALTMLTSNILFSQGPWTPWQMFAMGLAGFLAGILFKAGILRRTRGSLCVFGALCAIFLYGGIMNPVSVLMWSTEMPDIKVIAAYCLTGFPMDAIHAAATAFFMWFGARPLLAILDRIKIKFGLVEP